MTKYMLLYQGPATDMSQFSAEQSAAIMQKWAEWMQGIGGAMVEMGNPLINGTSVVDDGSESEASLLSGYTIIQAENLAGAKAVVAGHPFLSEGKGNYRVEIHEIAPVPGM